MESISTSSVRSVTTSNKEALKADLKVLLNSVSGLYESEVMRSIEVQDELVETIEVEF